MSVFVIRVDVLDRSFGEYQCVVKNNAVCSVEEMDYSAILFFSTSL